MPSTATITSSDLISFVASTGIKSAEVNSNFSVWRGHVIPISPSTSTAATAGTYSLGSSDYYWLYSFLKEIHLVEITAASTPATGFSSIYFKTDGYPYSKNSAGTESPLGGAFKIVNSRASPGTITAAGGISFDIATNGLRQYMFVTGDTTTGTDITANPQISAGTLGAELILCVPNTSTSKPIALENGTGLDQNGYFLMNAGGLIRYFHDGTEWLEQYRKDM